MRREETERLAIDWSMGQLFTVLKDLDLDENTLVIFTSDNGAWFEGSNGDWRQGKGTTWEGGYRVPLIACWPGRILPGTVSDAISMNIDILPTVAALVGVPLARGLEIDGRNIWSLFQGSPDSPHEFLYSDQAAGRDNADFPLGRIRHPQFRSHRPRQRRSTLLPNARP